MTRKALFLLDLLMILVTIAMCLYDSWWWMGIIPPMYFLGVWFALSKSTKLQQLLWRK